MTDKRREKQSLTSCTRCVSIGRTWRHSVFAPAVALLFCVASACHGALIAHYRFDDGDLIDDETGTYPLTLVKNGTATVTLNAAGYASFPGSENGNETYLETTGPGGSSTFTVSLWFRTDSYQQGDYQGIICNNSAKEDFSWQIHVDATNLTLLADMPAPGEVLGLPTADMTPNAWYHVVLRKNSSASNQTSFYVTRQGEAHVHLVAEGEPNPGGLQMFRLGVNRNSNKLLRMDMADVRIYNDATVDLDALLAESPDAPSILAFGTTTPYVAPGAPASLAWSVTGTVTCTISPALGDVSALTTNGSGHVTFAAPATTTVYTLTAANAAGLTSTAAARVGVGPPRPNILIFLVDDMGTQDTSEPFYYTNGVPEHTALNQRYRTPAMETLASRGMKFTSAYAMPVCTPTRTCIMTGMNSVRHHVTNWTDVNGADTTQNSTTTHSSPAHWRRLGMDETDVTLPRLLRDAGYRTMMCGKAHFGAQPYFGSVPENLGFDINIGGCQIGHPGSYLGTANFGAGGSHAVPDLDNYFGQDIFLTEALTREMIGRIGNAVSNHVPFFAYMAHYAVHSPFTADSRFTANYPALSGDPRSFATMIEGMDKSLSDILDTLDILGVAENTFVIFLGDNGSDAPIGNDNTPPLRGKKGTKWEGGSRVPMIAAWARPNPTNTFQAALPIAPGSHCDDIVAAFDIFPTVLGIAGAPAATNTIDGYDLRPHLTGTPGHHRPQELVIHYPHDHRSDYFSFLRQENWKLIYNYADDSFELYDLAADVGEATNRAAADPERLMRMARELARQLHAHDAQWPRFRTDGTDDPYAMPNPGPVDCDHDGLEDQQEDANGNGLIDPGETDPDKPDTDGDGTPDGAEAALGLDPLNPSQAFRLGISIDPNAHARLSWPSHSGTVFRAGSSTDFVSWTTLADNIAADKTATGTAFDAGPVRAAARHYYRVHLK